MCYYYFFSSHQLQLPQLLLLQLNQVLNLKLLLLMFLLVTQLIMLLVMLLFIINWGSSQSREHQGALKPGAYSNSREHHFANLGCMTSQI